MTRPPIASIWITGRSVDRSGSVWLHIREHETDHRLITVAVVREETKETLWSCDCFLSGFVENMPDVIRLLATDRRSSDESSSVVAAALLHSAAASLEEASRNDL